MNNQHGAGDSLPRITRPYVMPPDDGTLTVGKHRRAGPAVVEPATSDDLARAYSVAVDLNADPGEVQAAFDLIAEHSLTGEP
jgi:hypothetical protein